MGYIAIFDVMYYPTDDGLFLQRYMKDGKFGSWAATDRPTYVGTLADDSSFSRLRDLITSPQPASGAPYRPSAEERTRELRWSRSINVAISDDNLLELKKMMRSRGGWMGSPKPKDKVKQKLPIDVASFAAAVRGLLSS